MRYLWVNVLMIVLKKNNYSVGIKFVQAKKNDYLYEIIRDQLKQKKS